MTYIKAKCKYLFEPKCIQDFLENLNKVPALPKSIRRAIDHDKQGNILSLPKDRQKKLFENLLFQMLRNYYAGKKSEYQHLILQVCEILLIYYNHEYAGKLKELMKTSIGLFCKFYMLYSKDIPDIMNNYFNKGLSFIKKKYLKDIHAIKNSYSYYEMLEKGIKKEKDYIQLKIFYKELISGIQQNINSENCRLDYKKQRQLKKSYNVIFKLYNDLPDGKEFTEKMLEFFEPFAAKIGLCRNEEWILAPSSGLLDIFKGFASEDCTTEEFGLNQIFNPDFIN